MLMNMKELLKVADEKGFAVPAFNIGSDQLLKAVMQQVKEMKSPVILEMSPDEFNFVENSLIQSMIYEASKTDVPVVIHLDHGDKYETVVRAIQAGFTSVMIDASKLPYEENIAITQKVCEVAHLANVSVESELGTIGTTGNSIEGGTTGIIYTDPDQAKDFVEKTGIDTLAVAIGTAHGIYPSDMKPELRLDILQILKDTLDIPLVLHGGTGIPEDMIKKAISLGVSKIIQAGFSLVKILSRRSEKRNDPTGQSLVCPAFSYQFGRCQSILEAGRILDELSGLQRQQCHHMEHSSFEGVWD